MFKPHIRKHHIPELPNSSGNPGERSGGTRSASPASVLQEMRPRRASFIRRRHTCDFREHDTSAPAELGGEIHDVSRNRARAQVPLQARKFARLRKWHVWRLPVLGEIGGAPCQQHGARPRTDGTVSLFVCIEIYELILNQRVLMRIPRPCATNLWFRLHTDVRESLTLYRDAYYGTCEYLRAAIGRNLRSWITRATIQPPIVWGAWILRSIAANSSARHVFLLAQPPAKFLFPRGGFPTKRRGIPQTTPWNFLVGQILVAKLATACPSRGRVLLESYSAALPAEGRVVHVDLSLPALVPPQGDARAPPPLGPLSTYIISPPPNKKPPLGGTNICYYQFIRRHDYPPHKKRFLVRSTPLIRNTP